MKPTITNHGQRLVITRRLRGELFYWNGRRCEWVPEYDFRGASARNPKISFFTRRDSAEFELTIIARQLTPEAASDERSERYNQQRREIYRANKRTD